VVSCAFGSSASLIGGSIAFVCCILQLFLVVAMLLSVGGFLFLFLGEGKFVYPLVVSSFHPLPLTLVCVF